VNILETAIVTPLLLLLTFGVVDFGALFYGYLALENGVSQATRFAVTGNQTPDPDHPGSMLSRADAIIAAMRSATPTLTIPTTDFTFSHLPQGATAWVGGTGGPGDVEKVAVDYTWTLMTPIVRPFFTNGQLRMHVESAMKNEAKFQ
jgi:Flp pilus assembly protein TadG